VPRGCAIAATGADTQLAVTFYGVRGSTPCSSAETCGYGGNTSSVALTAPGEQPLMFDLGTGVRTFGLGHRLSDGPFTGSCLLSHLHWDHIQGLPFFSPLLGPGSRLDLYAPVQDDNRTVQQVMASTIRPPLFPIGIDQFAGTLVCHDTGDAEFEIGGYSVVSRLVPHVGPTLGYRVTWGGVAVAYISDHQQPYDGSHSAAPGVWDLIRDADLLIHDSQYTLDEFPGKATWGHCTVDYAAWLASEAGVRTLALFHHDPTRCDAAVEALLDRARSLCAPHGVEVVAAREGMSISLDARTS
jgi:ribonuclease BN (tRNA processing enzyme)